MENKKEESEEGPKIVKERKKDVSPNERRKALK